MKFALLICFIVVTYGSAPAVIEELLNRMPTGLASNLRPYLEKNPDEIYQKGKEVDDPSLKSFLYALTVSKLGGKRALNSLKPEELTAEKPPLIVRASFNAAAAAINTEHIGQQGGGFSELKFLSNKRYPPAIKALENLKNANPELFYKLEEGAKFIIATAEANRSLNGACQ